MNRRLTLKDLGAEKCINLLQPIYCDCHGYGQMIFETKQDVINFAGTLLEDVDCEHAYIFALTKDKVCGAFTDEDGVHAFTMSSPNGDDFEMNFEEQVDLVKDMIAEIEPHCVGIVQHTNNNRYRVVMETVYDRGVTNGKTKRRRVR